MLQPTCPAPDLPGTTLLRGRTYDYLGIARPYFSVDLARAIEANGLKIFFGVNPTFFAINADLDPDIRANA